MNTERIAILLSQLSVPDTETIKRAENELKPLLKDPACVPILFQLVQHTDINIRHTSSTLLRLKMKKLYKKLDQSSQQQVQHFLISAISVEPERAVRLMLAGVIAVVAEQVFESSQWTELLQFISHCYAQQTVDHRELTFILLNELKETIGEKLSESFESLSTLFGTALSDSEPKVKIAALTSGVRLMSCIPIEQNAIYFSNLFPQMVQVLDLCLKDGDQEIVIEVLDAFGDILQAPNSTINSHFPTFIPFILSIVSNSQLDFSIRDSAILVLSTIAEYKPKQLAKQGYVTPIVTALMQILIDTEGSIRTSLYQSGTILANIDGKSRHADGEGESDDEDYEEDDLSSIATSCLDMMACHLPHKHFFQPAVELCVQCMQQASSNARKAGVAVMGIIAEGCQAPLRGCLPQVMPFILQVAQDPSIDVRECVCFALGQLAEFCQPDILHFHKEVLEAMFVFLDETNPSVKVLSCHVVEQFCQNLSPTTLIKFVDPLMTKFMQMLSTDNRATQEIIISTISAIAFAAEDNFTPYFQSSATLVSQLLFVTEDDLLTLRGRSLECMGSMALAVGFDAFQPFIDTCMQSAVQGIQTEKLELQDFAYVFFGNLSTVAKERFSPFLEGIVPHLIDVINEVDTIPVFDNDDEKQFNGLHDSDEEDDEADVPLGLHFRVALVDVKKNAIGTLGTIAENTGAAFEQYLQRSFEAIKSQLENVHDIIRAEVASIFPPLVYVSMAAHPATPWEEQITELHPHTKILNDTLLGILIELIKEDADKKTVSFAIVSVLKIIERLGPMSLQTHGNALMEVIVLVLQGKSSYQTLFLEGDDEEDEGDDHDEGVMENLADLIGVLPKILGDSCIPFIDVFVENLFKYTAGSRPAGERAMAIGCFATLFQNMKDSSAKYIPQILPLVQQFLVDGEISVKRNSSFCLGVMCEVGKNNLTPYYLDFLQRLRPIFDTQCSTDAERGLVDNAAAAVARMIQINPDAIPLSHVLPLFLRVLPIENDPMEIPTIYSCLLFIIKLNKPDVIPHLPTIFKLFAWCFQEQTSVSESIQSSIVSDLRAFAASSPDIAHTAFQQCDAEVQAFLHQKLN